MDLNKSMRLKEKIKLPFVNLSGNETVMRKDNVVPKSLDGLDGVPRMIQERLNKNMGEDLGPSPYHVVNIYHLWAKPEEVMLTLRGDSTKTKDINRKYLRKYN